MFSLTLNFFSFFKCNYSDHRRFFLIWFWSNLVSIIRKLCIKKGVEWKAICHTLTVFFSVNKIASPWFHFTHVTITKQFFHFKHLIQYKFVCGTIVAAEFQTSSFTHINILRVHFFCVVRIVTVRIETSAIE